MNSKQIQEMIDTQAKKIAEKNFEKSYRQSPVYNDPANYDEGELVNLHKRDTSDERVVEFQKRCDDMYVAAQVLNKPVQSLNLYKSYRNWLEDEKRSELKKAMDTSTGGSGSEWIPTDFSRQLQEKVEIERKLAGMFNRVTMPTNPFKVPGQSSFSTAYKGSENTAPSSSAVGTRQVTFDAEKLITYVPVSYELNEDSVVALLPTIKNTIVKTINRAEEDCIINGDTSGTHMDSDVTSSADRRKCWKGLRKHAIEQSYTTDFSTFNGEVMADMFGDMGVYGTMSSECAWVVGPKLRAKLLYLKDASGNPLVITNDKLGANATIVRGQIGVLFGAPVIVSEFARENLNASGVYDGTTTTKGGILLAYTPGFNIGDRRKMMVEQDKQVKAQTIDLVASVREDFQPMHDITSETLCYFGYNITV